MDNGRLPERICTQGKSFYNLNTPLLVNYEKNGYQSLLNRRPLDIKTLLLGIIKWALFQYTRAFPPAAVMTGFFYIPIIVFAKEEFFLQTPAAQNYAFNPHTHTQTSTNIVYTYIACQNYWNTIPLLYTLEWEAVQKTRHDHKVHMT